MKISFEQLDARQYSSEVAESLGWLSVPAWVSKDEFRGPGFSEITPAVWENAGRYYCGATISMTASIIVFHGFVYEVFEEAKLDADNFASILRDEIFKRYSEGDTNLS